MGSHDGEIHIRDESSHFRERTGSGIACFRTLCGGETVYYELTNPPPDYRLGVDHIGQEATCMGCILVQLQNQAEAQAKGRKLAQRLLEALEGISENE